MCIRILNFFTVDAYVDQVSEKCIIDNSFPTGKMLERKKPMELVNVDRCGVTKTLSRDKSTSILFFIFMIFCRIICVYYIKQKNDVFVIVQQFRRC